jgi:hypothetical protein
MAARVMNRKNPVTPYAASWFLRVLSIAGALASGRSQLAAVAGTFAMGSSGPFSLRDRLPPPRRRRGVS